MLNAWIRQLKVTLTSDLLKKSISFGDEDNSININVSGTKYISFNKDSFKVEISNLTYYEIVQLIQGKYFTIKIEAGYKNLGINTIYEGSVLYISNRFDEYSTHTAIILCTSKLIAQYGQNKINISMSSGINMYAALTYICKSAGIKNPNISEQFRKEVLQTAMSSNENVVGLIDMLTSDNSNNLCNSDATGMSIVSLWKSNQSLRGVIKLTNNSILAIQGYPRLTNSGLDLTVLPSFSFVVGDVVSIDNSILDVSAESNNEVYENYTNFIDDNGEYIIYRIDYNLQNRGNNFQLTLHLKAKSLYMNVLER